MFGPESGKGAWTSLPFVYDKVRVGKNHVRQERCDKFLKIFEQEVGDVRPRSLLSSLFVCAISFTRCLVSLHTQHLHVGFDGLVN
jgi:hypothetical protein